MGKTKKKINVKKKKEQSGRQIKNTLINKQNRKERKNAVWIKEE